MVIDTVVEEVCVFEGVGDRTFTGGGREYTLSLLYGRDEGSMYGKYAVVATAEGVEVGNVLGRYFSEYPSPDRPSTEIDRVDVDEEHRRLGLATAMLDMLHDALPGVTKITMRSEAEETVRRLRGMLETVGFENIYSWEALERKIHFITALRL
tara:strand:- start:497 stop:955 length:459 start_codon:yes stop_codon:yes gene_type:complete